MLEAKIKFYNVNKCGYFLRGSSHPSLSNLSDTLDKLVTWGRSVPSLINRITYQHDPDEEVYATYYCNAAKNQATGDVLLTLWNEVNNDKGVIYGMNPHASPGATDILSSSLDDGAIPGFPSYFWFVPEMDALASITFPHSIPGKVHLHDFLNGFLLNKAPYRVKDADGRVIGFSQDSEPNEISARLYAKFHATGSMYSELEQELISNVDRITKILKREELAYSIPEQRKQIERIFSGLLPNSPQYPSLTRKVFHEMEFKPSVQELRQIISNFKDMNANSRIQNAGFVYSDGKRIMLKGISVSFKYELNVNRRDNKLIPAQELLTQISIERARLLRSFREPSELSHEV